jgi:spermidine synthase
MSHRKLGSCAALWVVVAFCALAPAADKTLFRKTSPYATIVVTEDSRGLRSLWFDPGYAPQSRVKVGDPDHIEFEYAKAMTVVLALVEKPQRVLMVGLGGGTIPNLLHKHYPKMAIDVVDIDPVVVEAAKKFFGFREDATLKVHVEDGRKYIEKCKEPYDLILLDAFDTENIPYDLATKEFLQAVRRALGPKGLVAANVWSIDSNPFYGAMVRTYQEVFDNLYIIDLRDSGNEIFLAIPRQERIERGDLARRAARISKENKFRFDMGWYVWWGFQPANTKDPQARVLLDKDKERKQKE